MLTILFGVTTLTRLTKPRNYNKSSRLRTGYCQMPDAFSRAMLGKRQVSASTTLPANKKPRITTVRCQATRNASQPPPAPVVLKRSPCIYDPWNGGRARRCVITGFAEEPAFGQTAALAEAHINDVCTLEDMDDRRWSPLNKVWLRADIHAAFDNRRWWVSHDGRVESTLTANEKKCLGWPKDPYYIPASVFQPRKPAFATRMNSWHEYTVMKARASATTRRRNEEQGAAGSQHSQAHNTR